MSRGLGHVQRAIMDFLIYCQEGKSTQQWKGTDWLPAIVYHNDDGKGMDLSLEKEKQAVWRAIRGLKKRGLIQIGCKLLPDWQRVFGSRERNTTITLVNWKEYTKCLVITDNAKHLEMPEVAA